MVLFQIPPRHERENERARQIIHTVAQEHGFDLALLRCGSKRPDLSYARHSAAAAAYSQTAVPVSEIAPILDRNHSSVRSGIRRMGLMV